MNVYIVKPLITEKTMSLVSRGWYTFRAEVEADKKRVKQEIELLYSVTVLSVRTCLMHGKVQRVGKKGRSVARSDWKKILVKLKAGQTIDAFQIGGQEEHA